MNDPIRLTQYSHGAGCGCKLSPAVLDRILSGHTSAPVRDLLVGNDARDDAGALDLGDGRALLTTTDFFMPIVDDPGSFGQIAAANAISDIYAMGGTPVMAIAILGWPVDTLAPEVASEVIAGARKTCADAGVALAGGHSIDSPEPIFGLSVNGLVAIENLKRNGGARAGDLLYLTKAIGVGILATAQKKGVLRAEDADVGAQSMMKLNSIGEVLGKLDGVHAMTDITGFGLLGHLGEMCRASGVHAVVDPAAVPTLTDLGYYLERGAIPGGTTRNWESYGSTIEGGDGATRTLLCDPQTSGGLLIAVSPESRDTVEQCLIDADLNDMAQPIGFLKESSDAQICISIARV